MRQHYKKGGKTPLLSSEILESSLANPEPTRPHLCLRFFSQEKDGPFNSFKAPFPSPVTLWHKTFINTFSSEFRGSTCLLVYMSSHFGNCHISKSHPTLPKLHMNPLLEETPSFQLLIFQNWKSRPAKHLTIQFSVASSSLVKALRDRLVFHGFLF